MKKKRYYHSKQDFKEYHQQLKFIPCPHCSMIACLILHGYLKGYDDETHEDDMIRGRRIFCSNRYRKDGCGRTFSLLKTEMIKYCTTKAKTIWQFLNHLYSGLSIRAAFLKASPCLSLTSAYRYYKKIFQQQHSIRTSLLELHPPPECPEVTDTLLQTIRHLKTAFIQHSCPVTAYQDRFQQSFLH